MFFSPFQLPDAIYRSMIMWSFSSGYLKFNRIVVCLRLYTNRILFAVMKSKWIVSCFVWMFVYGFALYNKSNKCRIKFHKCKFCDGKRQDASVLAIWSSYFACIIIVVINSKSDWKHCIICLLIIQIDRIERETDQKTEQHNGIAA